MSIGRLVLAVLLAAVAVAPGAQARDWKKVRIATDGAYPPFSLAGADGAPTGFDVEVARELCRRIAAECTVEAVGWDALLPALTQKRADALVASIPITEVLKRTFDVSPPYHRIPPRFVGRLRDAPADPPHAALDGVRIGVRAGTAHAAHLAAVHPRAVPVAFPSEAAAGAALLDGRVDLVFGDTPTLYRWLDGTAPHGVAGFVGGEVDDPARFGEGAGIVRRREDRDLGQLLDKALSDMSRDGTLDRLAGHWFPFAIR